ncbi:MAG: exodeoxyribonuclease VII large subunit [Acidobacteria bacterium]|nr:MAG: exodeoxyribonuclease VII large subunit [Acidobacteriota bacterium]
MKTTEFQRKIYSVSQLSIEIRDLLERRFIDVWVEGEISNFKTSAAGHLYFTLKDDRAQLPAVCFRNSARLLRFRPENGKLFRARGRVSTYEGRGEYQLIVEVLEPAGLGALQLAFEQLKEKLEKEGLFRSDRKRPIPAFPRKIGIVTSTKSAALRDILTVLKRRHNAINVLIFPAEVQGEGASLQIMEGIDYLSRSTDVDVIVIARGGGSMEDLWAFNEERVARAIVRARKPVISAVGHEVDFTISDFVADLRAPTPSAAAEIVIQSKEEISQRVKQLEGRLEGVIRSRIVERRHFLASKVGSRGFVVAETRIRRMAQRVDDLTFRLEQIGRTGAFIRSRAHRVEICEQRLSNAVHQRLKKCHQAFAGIAHTLEALSPLAVLERGYAICLTPEGHVIRSVNTVETDAAVKVRLHDGSLLAKVIGKERNETGAG